MFSDRAGIYHITHVQSGKMYIGSARNIRKRLYTHLHKLRKGTHENPKLRNYFNKYGEEAFSFGVLDYVEDIEELVAWEQQWIDTAKPWFNIRKVAHSNLGLKFSDETKARLSAIHKGNKYSLGHSPSVETRRKISRSNRGKVRTPEQIVNYIIAANRPERKTQNSILHKGKKYGLGYRHTEEAKIKMSAARRGKPKTTVRSDNKSGHIGVYYRTRDQVWVAKLNGKHLGQYKTLEEAVRVREKAVQELAMVKKGEREEVKLQAVQGVRQTVYDSGSSEVLLSKVSVA